ncbi:MAG TPA: polyprenol monophosphomannose synthase [Galbitalea sp.]|jgi:dolichol-phosphate mannosyltransferase|nr:polyprenol monophosphomannose synthase [Galbitalea sp.]
MADTLVIVPTYNEVENLSGIADRVLAASDRVELLVVDDNSPDGTGELADQLAEATPRIHVLHRATKSGLGDAYRAGFAWGLEHEFDVLVEMDGDGSHRPEQLPALLAEIDEADVVVGSRWVAGGGAPNWELRRSLLSRAGSLYARLALGLPYRDVTGGFRAYRRGALARLDYTSVRAQGYCFQIEMLWRASEAGLVIREVPIQFAERIAGKSKMNLSIVVEAVGRVTLWGIGNLPTRMGRALRGSETDSLLADANTSPRTPLHGGLAPAHSVDGRD